MFIADNLFPVDIELPSMLKINVPNFPCDLIIRSFIKLLTNIVCIFTLYLHRIICHLLHK